MTVTEASMVLPDEVQPQMVRVWIERGLLPARRVQGMPGARYKIDKGDFLRFAEERLQLKEEELALVRARVEALEGTPKTKGRGAGRPRGGAQESEARA